MMANSKTVIIGLDGVPFDLLRDLADTGVMPHTKALISAGTFRQMHSSIPEISSVAWSSMITGCNPGTHGIFGFTDLAANSYRTRFPNYTDLKAPTFWDQWRQKAVIINVPATYPVREMNGVHISGFVSIDIEKSVWPRDLVGTLNGFDYRLDVDSLLGHRAIDLFLADLDKTLEARIRAYRYLWENCDWKLFVLVFTGTDRLMHFLWQAYEDKQHRYHDSFLEHFRKIDEAVGQISEKINDDDLLVMLSDHGFELLEKDIYISYLLEQEGFLKLQSACEPTLESVERATKAFALDPSRIYLNSKGRYPAGSVEKADRERILRDLEQLFNSLEVDGKKVIAQIYRKEQIYSGPFLEQAPELLLLPTKGFNLKAKLTSANLTDKPIFTGKHEQQTAFLLIRDGFDSIIPDRLDVSSVKGIVEAIKRAG
jgi:predicted AlkP superfamily phosphohydrolase/phosphomutase